MYYPHHIFFPSLSLWFCVQCLPPWEAPSVHPHPASFWTSHINSAQLLLIHPTQAPFSSSHPLTTNHPQNPPYRPIVVVTLSLRRRRLQLPQHPRERRRQNETVDLAQGMHASPSARQRTNIIITLQSNHLRYPCLLSYFTLQTSKYTSFSFNCFCPLHWSPNPNNHNPKPLTGISKFWERWGTLTMGRLFWWGENGENSWLFNEISDLLLFNLEIYI